MATSEERGLRLLEQALDIVTQQTIVEDIHDRLDTGDDNETLIKLIIVLQDHLQAIFEPHGPACIAS